ncbi:MAG: tetratricopeptide repeat protein [Desulfovibrionaceae bacterium]|nr:tetratricopeptide repeat protein [Desulfovibrionaceae bacterium]
MSMDTQVSLDGRERFRFRRGRDDIGRICCIFSTPKSRNVIRGTTLRGHGRTHYWLVRQVGEAAFGVRGVDGKFLPFHDEAVISADELLAEYTPEVAVFEDCMLPAAKRHGYRLAGDGPGSRPDGSVLRLDESNVRGLFELGLEYILAGLSTRGRNLIRELIRVKTPFSGKDQFLFNEFGIRLRKIDFLDGAVICYRRALKYTDSDDHLHYNLARAYYEQGQWWDCMRTLAGCFVLNPQLPLARDLVMLTHALARNDGLRIKYGKPPVPDGVARQAGLLAEGVHARDVTAPACAEAVRAEAGDRRKKELWLPGREAVGL